MYIEYFTSLWHEWKIAEFQIEANFQNDYDYEMKNNFWCKMLKKPILIEKTYRRLKNGSKWNWKREKMEENPQIKTKNELSF